MTGNTQGVVYYVLLQWYQKWENLPTTWAAGRSASQEIGKRSGPHLNTKTVFPGMGIPMLKIRQWGDRLIFNSLRTHICVNKLTIIGSDNGLSPGQCQAIIWTNAGIVLIWTSGTNFSEIFKRNSCIFIHENAFENVICEMAAILSWPRCVYTGIPILVRRHLYIETPSFFFFCCSMVPITFTHILPDSITNTGTIIRLAQCQWINPEMYG